VVHAIRQYEFGTPDVLRYEPVPDPAAGAGQVRIAVDVSGVHVLDTLIRRGDEGGPFPLPALPMTPGREVAGVVDEVGPGVDSGWLGRRVVAHLGQANGGYAARALAVADRLNEIPGSMSAAVAVAMIGTGRTAVGILERAQLTSRDVVVVTAAAGGLGALFVQEAHAAGATVVALAGGGMKVERVRELGAEIAIDYLPSGWPDDVRDALDGRPATVVLDGVGGAIGSAAFDLLGAGGRIARFGWTSGAPAGIEADEFIAHGVSDLAITGADLLPRLAELEAAALDKARSGAWRPLVQDYALAGAADAHRAIESRATIGKVVLIV
jgi:NADPH2:quinone reductase